MSSPNVLLLILDSVRAANTSLHGYERDTTPKLEEFAKDATTYTAAKAPSTWSLPSHVSIFSGYHVVEHGVVRMDQAIEAGHSVWETLSNDGYATGLFTDNHFVTKHETGLSEPFDHVDTLLHRTPPIRRGVDPFEHVGDYPSFLRRAIHSPNRIASFLDAAAVKLESEGYHELLPSRLRLRPLSRVGVDALLDWTAKQDGPWAACVNIMDCHDPYTPLSEYDKWGSRRGRSLQRHRRECSPEELELLKDLYDGALRQVDANLGRLFETLRQRGSLDETLVVVTSDHGEAFGEQSYLNPNHRERFHGPGLTREEVLHVPLVVRYPRGIHAGQEDRLASLTNFPAAITATREKNLANDPFCTASPIIASTVDEELADEAPHNRLTDGRIHSVYHREGGTNYRTVVEGDSAAQLVVNGRGAEIVSQSPPLDSIQETLSSLEDRGVRRTTRGFDDADPMVRERLRQLGYTE